MKLLFREFALLTLLALANATVIRRLVSPRNDPFYEIPENVTDVPPGTVLKHRKPPMPISDFGVAPINLKDTHQILYKTTDSLNASTATVLTVLIPHNADMNKVLSYQFMEDSADIECAPSYVLQQSSFPGGPLSPAASQIEFLLAQAALDRGWVVIMPDFQGPKAAFLANALAGHSVLDGIRAATRSTELTGISQNATVALWGYSGGSLAAGWAAELQPTYAPDVRIAGAALGGTVPNIPNVITASNKSLFAGLLPAGILGLAHQYPEIADLLKQHLLPQHKPAFDKDSLYSHAPKSQFARTPPHSATAPPRSEPNKPLVRMSDISNSLASRSLIRCNSNAVANRIFTTLVGKPRVCYSQILRHFRRVTPFSSFAAVVLCLRLSARNSSAS
ncbi:hypothetical protein HIM_07367 [Hirsutella minnesotensis 3608]|uniref:Uncharacterized protein n=1 Tax=Hirsutella minnesotensis 3608 TaxID=1043627 RepID=A0A0F7ZN57_9HYPO|nr:hypothetical protein HIM_07367 [Hirsutella minnesotensis 3608]